MNLNVNILGFDQTRINIRRVQKTLTTDLPRILKTLAEQGTALIKNRVVERGLDVNNAPFKAYSDQDARTKGMSASQRKTKAGGKARQTADAKAQARDEKVNLFLKGHLIGKTMSDGSIFRKMQNPSEALIYVGGAPAVYGMAHQYGLGRMPVREWFGLASDERSFLAQLFQELIDQSIGDLFR